MKKNQILALIAVFFIGSYFVISCRHELPVPDCTFTYSEWSTCDLTGHQTRSFVAGPAGCVGNPPEDSINRSCTTTPPSCPTITVTGTPTNPTSGSNGTISISASGSVAPYTYNINGGTFGNSTTFSSLSAGTYTIIAKDQNGCSGSKQYTLILVPPTCPNVTVSGTPTHPTNGANGSISASASGGVSPYTYSIDGGAYAANSTFSSLASGAHTIAAKDNNGCPSSTIIVTLNCPTLNVTGTPTSSRANCVNNSISITASNGIAPYTYSKDGVTYQSNSTITPLAGGTYTITAKDNNGCTGSGSVIINAPATVSFASSIKPIINSTCGRANVSCHNHTNAWTTYSDIVGTSNGSTWSSNLLTFIQRVRGTSTSTDCLYSSLGRHDMPPTNTTAWTTFIQGVFTNWVNQGYPNN